LICLIFRVFGRIGGCVIATAAGAFVEIVIWEILKTLCGAGPVSIREAARRVGRDVKAVHGDVVALLDSGILQHTDDDRIEFPYDKVKVEFLLRAGGVSWDDTHP